MLLQARALLSAPLPRTAARYRTTLLAGLRAATCGLGRALLAGFETSGRLGAVGSSECGHASGCGDSARQQPDAEAERAELRGCGSSRPRRPHSGAPAAARDAGARLLLVVPRLAPSSGICGSARSRSGSTSASMLEPDAAQRDRLRDRRAGSRCTVLGLVATALQLIASGQPERRVRAAQRTCCARPYLTALERTVPAARSVAARAEHDVGAARDALALLRCRPRPPWARGRAHRCKRWPRRCKPCAVRSGASLRAAAWARAFAQLLQRCGWPGPGAGQRRAAGAHALR